MIHSPGTQHQADAWGDAMEPKAATVLRIGFQNIGGLPQSAAHYKNQALKNYIKEGHFDVFGFSEVNLHWNSLPAHDQFSERFYGSWESSHSLFAHNTNDRNPPAYQIGGAGILSVDEVTHRVIGCGQDPRKLGRWVWTRYRGKQDVTLRIISAYRAVNSRGGPFTTWRQQRSYFQENDINTDPRQMFFEDLIPLIRQWTSEGDQIILMLDANGDVRTDVQQQLSTCDLREAIISQHPTLSPTATYNRNRTNTAIDGIFISTTLSISKAGYRPFGEGIGPDHRVLWLDLSYELAFGHDLFPSERPRARRLQCRDPRIVSKYLFDYSRYLEKHRLPQRAQALLLQAQFPLLPTQATEYEAIDALRMQGVRYAESRCRKLKMGAVSWSPNVQKIRNEIEVWNLIIRKRKGCKVSSTLLRRKVKLAGLPDATSASLSEALDHRTITFRKYQKVKKDSRMMRDSWLDSLAEAKSLQDGKTAKQHKRDLKRIEHQRTQARNVKRMNGKLIRTGTTKIIAPDEFGVWQECVTKATIEKGVMWENERRFRQTNDTPFMVPPLLQAFGYLGIGPSSEAVLHGSYDPPLSIDPYTTQFLQQLRRPAHIPIMPPSFSVEDHILGWRKAKEFTSAGTTGFTFSHFKAGTEDKLVATFDHAMAHIPYSSGYSPQRWRKAIDVTLLKKALEYHVDKTRQILLLDAEFNMNNKRLGRDLMRHAEQYKLMAPEQYGSRKQHRPIEAALNKRLTCDMWRQQRTTGALCANDAKSCYDRMVHSVTSLSMQSMGAPPGPVVSMFTTLQKLRHFIRTSYGDSQTSIGASPRHEPFQGIGQGNGCGPTGWAVVSTPLINLMRAAGFGAYFLTALTIAIVTFVCYAFVDDTDLVHMSKSRSATGEDVLPEMQDALDHWEGGLRATGGALVPSKSYWYLIDFKWDGTHWQYRTQADMPGVLTMKDHTGHRAALLRLEPEEARETLGIMQSMDGKSDAQVQKMLDITKAWSARMRCGHLSREDSWYALNSTVCKSLEYPLSVTTLSRLQCKSIMTPILMSGLPASGIARTFPRDVTYAPLKFQGLGIKNLYVLQGIQHIQILLKHSSTHTITGRLLRASMEEHILEIGSQFPVLSLNYDEYGCLATDTWIAHTWHFLHQYHLILEDDLPRPSGERDDDVFLIDAFVSYGYRGTDLHILNRCRQYLRVVLLSHIVDAGGSTILEEAFLLSHPFPTAYTWPRSSPILPSDLLLWQRALQTTFCSARSRTVRKRLGPWHTSPPTHQLWYHDPVSRHLYYRQPASFLRFEPRRHSRRRQFYTQKEAVSELPPDCQRATVAMEHHGPLLVSIGSSLPAFQITYDNFEDYLQSLPEDSRWAIAQLGFDGEFLVLINSLIAGTLIAVSDGSFKDSFGTAAFTLVATGASCVAVNVVPGPPPVQCAYRSELSGLYGIVLLVNALCTWATLQDPCSITIGCDGESALLSACGTDLLDPTSPHYDFVKAIRFHMAAGPVTWIPRHIEGHQDDKGLALDEWANLNIAMDSLAKVYWTDQVQRADIQHHISGEGWRLGLPSGKLSSFPTDALYDLLMEDASLDWWLYKNRFPSDAIRSINWDACKKALLLLPLHRRRWISKHVAGICGVGKMMKIWGYQDNDHCPRCSARETAQHVWVCPQDDATILWDQSLLDLKDWFVAQHTSPEVASVILSRLRAWRTGEALLPIVTRFPGLQAALQAQDQIGWLPFFEGCLAHQWTSVQQHYLNYLGRRTTGLSWTSALIRRVWMIAWELWEHRNNAQHSGDSPHQRASAKLLKSLIQIEYRQGPRGLDRRDRSLFRLTLEQLLLKPLLYQRAWLANVNAARHASQLSLPHQRLERGTMRRWLASSSSR